MTEEGSSETAIRRACACSKFSSCPSPAPAITSKYRENRSNWKPTMSAGSVLHDLKNLKEPIIACDLDDVLSATNQTVSEFHNDTYGTNMNLSHFFYYYYWRNPGWGSPKETAVLSLLKLH
ncbi:hypothetical protein BJ322DRAFT_763891 [Thelephora terrestris]|uniref:Uncharacterized protein n=1 Tax=Thelephora terrestris TaxID=56493 RepID=A0A9P6HFB6_9AGAM|nr:hypothetical protein BJ322DRAFT_763891 [Thelephora terrestris]